MPIKARSSSKSKAAAADEAGVTSAKIFRKFMKTLPDGRLDAAGVVSSECYAAWLAARKHKTMHPEKAFQRTLAGHLTGSDGRRPFTEEEESAVLAVLRKRMRWPCFEHLPVRYGEAGFRTKGYHERLREERSSVNGGTTSATSSIASTHASSEGVEEHELRRSKRRRALPESEEEDDDYFGSDDGAAKQSNDEQKEGGFEKEFFEELVHRARFVEVDDPTRYYNMNVLIVSCLAIVRTIANWSRLWDILYMFTRMRVYAKGWFSSPSDEEIAEVMNELNAKYPNDGIVLISMTQSSFKDRFIAQNENALKFFGPIAKQYGGFSGKQMRMEPRSGWVVLLNILKAHAYPSVEHICDAPLRSDVGRGPSRMYRIIFTADESRRFVVERTIPLN
jgi:hypothetical protein